jgi:phosphopantetheinyl transferase
MSMLLAKAPDTLLCRHLSDKYLSDQEKWYLSKLRHDRRINEYVTSRLMVKLLLQQSLKHGPIAASQLELYAPPANPPKLYCCQQNLQGLFVSVSHSRGLVLVGITEHSAIGLDIEHVAGHDWLAIFAYMQWPIPALPNQVPIEVLCCCIWTIFEAGFKLYGGLVSEADFHLCSISFHASGSVMSRCIFTFEAAFQDQYYGGKGLAETDWAISVAKQCL